LRIGDKFIDEIDTAIRIREKVVLVLSENSIKSVWVEDEVTTAEERKRGTTVLFRSAQTTRSSRRRRPGRPSCARAASAISANGRTTTTTISGLSSACETLPRRNSHKSKRFLRGESSRRAPRSLLGHPGKLRGTTRFTAGC
jgi:TIR domain